MDPDWCNYSPLSTRNFQLLRVTSTACDEHGQRFGALTTAGRRVRISPDTGDGSREAGAGRDGDGGEAEDPAEGRARTGHPGSGIDDAEANWAPFSF